MTDVVNPGAQKTDEQPEVSVVLPFEADDYARVARACEVVAAERGHAFTVHDAICESLSEFVRAVEARHGEAGEGHGGGDDAA